MVAAGIYLLCRIGVMMTPDALDVVLFVGAATAFYAGVCAITQKDIKKILAYSTISQLGYMVAAFALGSMLAMKNGGNIALTGVTLGVGAAMFHLTTHAFFKALLFLGAGSIIHSCHHEQNIFKMGGLAKRMPLTFVCFFCGYLALIGFPFVSGFFSKDAILYLAREVSPVAYWVLVLGALITVTYMTRLMIIVFLGRPKSEPADMAHESPLVLTLPLIVLAALSLLGGYMWIFPHPLSDVLHNAPHPEGAAHDALLITSSILVVVGVLAAWFFYRPGAADDRLEQSARPIYSFLNAKLWFDEIYNGYVANVQERFAQLLGFLEHLFISGLVVRGSAAVAGVLGIAAKSLQTGNLHGYVFWFFGGLVIFALVAFLKT
jgi:NADH-quinone oxidoreductase subunit L